MIPGDIGAELARCAAAVRRALAARSPAPGGRRRRRRAATPPRCRSSWPARRPDAGRSRPPAWPPGCAGPAGSAPRPSPAAATSPSRSPAERSPAWPSASPAAGPACARSDALRGTDAGRARRGRPGVGRRPGRRPGRPWPPRSPAGWPGRRARQVKSLPVPERISPAPPVPAPVRGRRVRGRRCRAVRAGPDGSRAGRAAVSATSWARNDLGNPFFAVSFAHADAASALRWAAGLGLDRGPSRGVPARGCSRTRPSCALLGMMSWLPERVAGAARRRRPDAFLRYLEDLAAAWLACRESCPALPFGGAGRAAGRPGRPRPRPGCGWRRRRRPRWAPALRLGGLVPPERL